MPFQSLKVRFAAFLRTHRFARHFRRLALFESMASSTVSRALPDTMAQTLQAAATVDADSLLASLGSRRDGLRSAEADAIRAAVGTNTIEHEKPLPWWQHLAHCYANPFNLLLTLLAVVSHVTGDEKATVVISTMVLLSTLLRFVQEVQSNQAADALKALVSNTATVLRAADLPSRHDAAAADHPTPVVGSRNREDGTGATGTAASRNETTGSREPPGTRVELPLGHLVPGDILQFSAGDMIPADCRLLDAKDLFVNQAAMTGESLPVEKFASCADDRTCSPLERGNLVFMGTHVVSGSALAVVIATGQRTYFGALALRVSATDRSTTAFQSGVNRVSWLLIRFMFVMAPLVLFVNGFTKGDWGQALLFALSVAVGLTPEMLPMIVTSTLAKGAVFLSRKKVIVKRLDAIQNFGAMDVLCTDKTGTLTQDRIVLARHMNIQGEQDDAVLALASLNSHYQTGLKNLLDEAVLEHARTHLAIAPAGSHRKLDEIPFDFARRRMSVVVQQQDQEENAVLICKGAVEEVLTVCTQVRMGGSDQPLDTATLAHIRQMTARLNDEGLRVVALATRTLPPGPAAYGRADERELTLVGYVAFLDPPKISTAPALQALAAHGVTVKILTGDNERVTARVCQQVGLPAQGIVVGNAIDAMGDATLAATLEQHHVFARLTPAHKERIVRTLMANGHVVGFMGDGINDAPALRTADIGISVDTGVDIAREAADIILLEKSLMVLEEGVREGRRTFANMLKYIRMTASSNFGNVFSVLVASAFVPFLPMLPMHLLVQNLLYDLSQIAIPFDHVDEELLLHPQHWQPGEVGRFMVFFGPISSLFDIITFAMMWFVFGANSPAQQTLFQSGWFVEGLLTQTLVVHMIRTSRIPFLQSRPAAPLLVMTGLVMAIGLFLPMGPLAHYFKLQPLPPLYFACLPVILLAYAALTQALKGFYIRRYQAAGNPRGDGRPCRSGVGQGVS